MAQLDVLAQPQRQQRRQEEHRLQLEGERHAEKRHAPRAALLQCVIQRQQAQRRIDHVALTPIRAVENDGRQHQRQAEEDDAPRVPPNLQPRQLGDGVGHQRLKRHRNDLDQILPRIIPDSGNQQQQVQIRRRVIAADVCAEPFPDAHLGVAVDPAAQEDVVIVAHIVKQRNLRQQNHADHHAEQRLRAEIQPSADVQRHRRRERVERGQHDGRKPNQLLRAEAGEFVDLGVARVVSEDREHRRREQHQRAARPRGHAPPQQTAQRVVCKVLVHSLFLPSGEAPALVSIVLLY